MKKLMLMSFILLHISGAYADVKADMDRMLSEIFTLKPYMVSDEKYRDPKNAPVILKSLQRMSEIAVQINHEDKIKKTGFQAPAKVLGQQLKEAQIIFEAGNKDYSLWMLKSTLGVCMSCHTQLPSVSTRFNTLNKTKLLVDSFEEAEFLFTIRNFKEAMPLYLTALKEYPQGKVTIDSLEKIIYRQLYYYIRVERDFKALAKTLEEDLQNKKLPTHQRAKISELIKASKEMSADKFPEFSANQTAELRTYVETNLRRELAGEFNYGDSKKDLNYLKVSGIMYEFLNANPETPLKPDILYWLSFCETQYRYQAFYSLPELYLKQCVVDFPESKVAPKCLKEYQDLITFAYSGSRGTHIPSDVTKELKTMQELVKKVKN